MKISKTFKELLPELRENEKEILDRSIEAHGIIEPVIVWKEKDTLIHGHNRLEFGKKHKKKLSIKKMSFPNEKSAKDFVLQNQLGKRNLSEYQKCLIASKVSDTEKLEKLAKNNNKTHTKQGYHSVDKAVNFNKEMGRKAGVSTFTYAKFRKIQQYKYHDCIRGRVIALENGDKNENISSTYNEIIKYEQSHDIKKLGFKPQIYNEWRVAKKINGNNFFGSTPVEFMQNLIHAYTKKGDGIYDPMAGNGTALDVAKQMGRIAYCYDRNPKRKEITKFDIKYGIPKNLPENTQFVYLDPPYWIQAKNKYSKDKEDLANMSLDDFYKTITNHVAGLLNSGKLKKGFKIALIISATQFDKPKKADWIDHPFDLTKRFLELGLKVKQKIYCPYTTNQFNGAQINYWKGKVFLNVMRELIIFEKDDK